MLKNKRHRDAFLIPELRPDGRSILLQDTRARQTAGRAAGGTTDLISGRIGRPDVSTRKTIRETRERVRTHHHSDVLRQVPGAPLEEIRERCLHTHTHREKKPINELQFVAFASLKRDNSPACFLSRLPRIIYSQHAIEPYMSLHVTINGNSSYVWH